MTVAELIEKLQGFNQKSEVVVTLGEKYKQPLQITRPYCFQDPAPRTVYIGTEEV